MSEKVALPREVAEAIEELRSQGIADWKILHLSRGAISTKTHLDIKRWAFDLDGEGTPDLLMQALVNGYEIERNPHEELRDYYQSLDDCDSYDVVVSGAIETTLRILGITVEGINDINTSTDAT